MVYVLVFYFHFLLLTGFSQDSLLMSPEFQSSLHGHPIVESLAAVAYGSRIILRHEATNDAFLHSFRNFYPAGSRQQVITCNHEKSINFYLDESSFFKVKNRPSENVGSFQLIHHQSIIRLQHIITHRCLHSHDVRLK